MLKQPVEDQRLVVLASSVNLSDRRLYWSNLQGLLLRGKLGRFVALGSRYMACSRVPVFDSVNSAKQLRNLVCRRVNLIIPSSTGTLVQVSFCWWCMWIILLSLGVTLQESHPLTPFFKASFIQRI